MRLHNFTIRDSAPLRTSGPGELGDIPADVVFDRPTPDMALVTVRPVGAPGDRLPAECAAVTSLVILDQTVPVSVVRIEDESEALRGSVDPVLLDAFLAAAPTDAGPGTDPEQAQDAGPAPSAPAPAADPLVAKCREFERAHAAELKAREEVVGRRRIVKRLSAELEDANEDLAESEQTLLAREAETLEARRQVLDAGRGRGQ